MQRQMRLIIGHLSRVAVSAAELSRGLAYLTSAIDQNNMFLLQLYPGYIQMQGKDSLFMSTYHFLMKFIVCIVFFQMDCHVQIWGFCTILKHTES